MRLIGETLAHYRVVEHLGRGGMGDVYLAEDLTLRRRVALKVCAGEEAAGGRLLHEARAASALTHPAIAVVYEAGEWERGGRRQAFIAMEYVAGRTLQDLARERALPEDEALDLVAQVVEALASAHARGVVHRDVKPSNVMVTDDGRVKVLDFGLAKHVPFVGDAVATWSGQGRLEELGALLGTAAYMSPEQARGEDVDARTDVFSLGVVLYELLAGRRPFLGPSAVEVLGAVLHQEPPPLDALGRAVRPAVARVVERMLAKQRERRFAAMSEVGAALAAARRGAPPPPSPAPSGPGVVAAVRFTNVTGGAEDDWLGTGIAETLIADLKSREGLVVVSRERSVEVMRKLALHGVSEEALPDAVGREVGARLVVGGAYQRRGEEVRVTVRVTEASSGALVGTFKADGRMGEIFALQDRIAAGVAAILRVREAGARPSGETEVVEAYEAFARGLVFLREESLDSLDRATAAFARAVALDPAYARAHVLQGVALGLRAAYLGRRDLSRAALDSLRRAVALRPSLAEAWRELGATLVTFPEHEEEGLRAIEHALALDPRDAAAHSALARAYFVGQGDFARAAAAYERALVLNPQAGWSALQLAHCAAFLGDFVRGEGAALRAIVLQEEFLSGKEGMLIVGAYVRLGHLYARQGRHAEARREFERELLFLSRVDHPLKARIFIELETRLGASLRAAGEERAGAAALDLAVESFERRLRLGGDDPFTRYYAAAAYALRGDHAQALECLEKAAAGRRAFTLARARIDPLLEGLGAEPAFRALVGQGPDQA